MQIEEPFEFDDANRVPNAAQNATSLSGHQGGALSVFGFLRNHAGVTRECLRALRCVQKYSSYGASEFGKNARAYREIGAAARWLREQIPAGWNLKGSVGQGSWANVPWICAREDDGDETGKAQVRDGKAPFAS